jgi:putative proteasome-type protease
MTFCLGISVSAGLVALADTRVVKGDERLSKGKLEVIDCQGCQIFIMTSGLRSVRDKAVIYLKDRLQAPEPPLDRLYQVANAFGTCLRRVREEDEAALNRDGLHFNSHAIIGGQLSADAAPGLFYLYPAGNWIESARDSPYFLIGRTSYGKPILDRLLTRDSGLMMAVNLGYLAFDATRTSVTDVDFPLEILIYDTQSQRLRQHSFTEQELLSTSQWWKDSLATALNQMPTSWAQPLFTESVTPGEGK